MNRQQPSTTQVHAQAGEQALPALPARAPSWFEKLFQGLQIPGEIELPDGRVAGFGEGAPRFRITVHSGKILRRPHDEFSLGQAYVNGQLDLDGDMLAILEVRKQLADRFRMGAWMRFMTALFLMPATRAHKKAVESHYTLGNDFYLHFLDSVGRFYSHCLFERDDETLEQAAVNKLDRTYQALELHPGTRLLEIGAGWGGTLEYF